MRRTNAESPDTFTAKLGLLSITPLPRTLAVSESPVEFSPSHSLNCLFNKKQNTLNTANHHSTLTIKLALGA